MWVGAERGANSPHFVADTYGQNRLLRVFEDVDNLAGRGFEVHAFAVGEQVMVRFTADGFREACAEILLQRPYDFADALQRKTLPAQLADDGEFRQISLRIDAAVAVAP